MSFNGSGTFVVNSAGQPVVTGTTITSTAFNLLTADLATGLTTTLTKDGQSTPTANIPMGSFKLTGLANGTAAADAVRMSQLQSNGANYITVAGTADVITGGVTPALTAYAAGNEFVFVVGSTNTTSVTLNVDGLGAKAITKDGTGALTAGDLTAGDVALIVYDGTRFQLVSASYGVSSWAGGTTGLTPASATTGAVSLAGTLVVANGGTGAATLTANNVLLGNGTSAVQVVAPGSSGNLLTSNGTTWSSTAPSGGGVTTFTAGTTGFTPSTATSGAVTLSGTLAVANGGTGGSTSTGTGAVVLATNPALVGYTVNTASGVDGEWTTAGLTVYADGVTPQHDRELHVMDGTSGAYTASTNVQLVVESAGQAGIQLMGSTSNNLFFGKKQATGAGYGYMQYSEGSGFEFGTVATGEAITVLSGNGVTAMTINSSQNATFAGTVTATSLTATGATLSVKGQRLQSFLVYIKNQGGSSIQGYIVAPGAAAFSAGNFLTQVTGVPSASQLAFPTGTDSSTAMSNGGKISSANTNVFILNTATAQVNADSAYCVSICSNSLTSVLAVICNFTSRNVNGVTQVRPEFNVTVNGSGNAYALTTANMGTNASLILVFLGLLV